MLTFFMLRMLRRRSYLTYEQRRSRFFCMAAVYLSIFLVAGFVFLGLYLANHDDQVELYPMIICFAYAGVELLLIIFCLLRGNPYLGQQNNTVVIDSSRQYPLTANYNSPYSNYPNKNRPKAQNMQQRPNEIII
jgi:ABC-type transport system involved in cytochrome c biogenesis permease subunit